jgi:hypothetical protein
MTQGFLLHRRYRLLYGQPIEDSTFIRAAGSDTMKERHRDQPVKHVWQ